MASEALLSVSTKRFSYDHSDSQTLFTTTQANIGYRMTRNDDVLLHAVGILSPLIVVQIIFTGNTF